MISTLEALIFRKKVLSVGLAAGLLVCGALDLANVRADVRVNERVFTFRLRDEPQTLDWNKASTLVESSILMNLMEGLVSFEGGPSGLEVSPALAESWRVSPDGKTYTFKLRPGVKWSDGVPLKAEHFLYSWKRLLSPLTGAPYAYFLFDIEGAEEFNKGTLDDFSKVGISAPDDLTFQVKLKHPLSFWTYIPAFWVTFPIRKDIIEKYGNTWEAPGKMVTVGPYCLVSHDTNSNFMLKANVFYKYRPRGNVDKIVAHMVKDDDEALKQYEAGALDFLTDIATKDLKRLMSTTRPDLKRFPHLKTAYLGFSVSKYPISNVHLRRAIAMAIDKNKLTNALFGGAYAATTFVPPPLMSSAKFIGLPFNPQLARQELKASGLTSGGNTVQLDFVFPDWDKVREVADFIQAELKTNLGIEIKLKPLENRLFRNQLELGSFPSFHATWTADYPDPDNFLSLFLSASGNNRTGWKLDLYDTGVREARLFTDPRQREAQYLALQKVLLEAEAAVVPLYYEPNLALVQPRVRNFSLNALDYLYLRNVNVSP